MKRQLQRAFRYFGYEIHKVEAPALQTERRGEPPPHPTSSVHPVWPLPRGAAGPSPDQIREEFAKYPAWHYAYEFVGGLSFPRRYEPGGPSFDPQRQWQRFRHFMPYLLDAQNGSLAGKRVLDIACNSGFWSIQCALLGAEVVGFDARNELVEQAKLLKRIVGLSNVDFKLLDFWQMSPESLGGTFDVVLNLGLLYHLSSPVEALQRTKLMSRDCILLDTQLLPWANPVVKLQWEEAAAIQNANRSGIVANPTKSSVELILRDIGASDWFEIPIRTTDMPQDYLDQSRASWLIKV
jgi:2-polyprenyl-3-methyl-5-hydroxy-6-metoxy-1,4-benzoquinol methylase